MPSKRQVLDLLSRDELVELGGRHDRTVRNGRSKAQLADALDGRGPQLPELLAGLSRDRQKELCRGLDLDDGSRENATAAGAARRISARSPLSPERRRSRGAEPRREARQGEEGFEKTTEGVHVLQRRRTADARMELR